MRKQLFFRMFDYAMAMFVSCSSITEFQHKFKQGHMKDVSLIHYLLPIPTGQEALYRRCLDMCAIMCHTNSVLWNLNHLCISPPNEVLSCIHASFSTGLPNEHLKSINV